MEALQVSAAPVGSRKFVPVTSCWICGSGDFGRAYPATFRMSEDSKQDPELLCYDGEQVRMQRCLRCGFRQPDVLPALPDFFERLYNQHWSDTWMKEEFHSTYKDYIFSSILRTLDRLVPANDRSLLDIGAHVGRFMSLAGKRGWKCEGIELNPLSSAFAQRSTGNPVHRMSAHDLIYSGHNYSAVTLIDVLEHIPEPLAVLTSAAKLLKSEGWLAVKVPCAPAQELKERARSYLSRDRHPTAWLAENLVHASHFSPCSLKLALERTGFRNIRIEVGAPELFDRKRTRDTWGKRLANMFRLGVYHGAQLIPGRLRSPLALHLQVYAQKDN